MWMNIKEVANAEGVSEKTIRRRQKKGEWKMKRVAADHGGSDIILLNYTVGQLDTVGQKNIVEKKNTVGQLDTVGQKNTVEKKNTVGQLGTVGQLDKNDKPLKEVKPDRAGKEPDTHPQAGAVSDILTVPAAPKILDLTPDYNLPERYDNIAKLRGQLCDEMINILNTRNIEISKTETWNSIEALYKTENLIPELYKLEGPKSARSLQRWLKDYLDNKRDYTVLAPNYKIKEKGHNIPEFVMDDLLNIILHPNRISIGSAINLINISYKSKNKDSGCSNSTLRRSLDDYKKNNPILWTLAREGVKSYRDNIGMSLTRDTSILNVGDVWVTDGHRLAFDIIDLDTGKPKRFNLVVFYDWASRLPVGCSLNLTENSQTILSAFRAAVLFTGYVPKIVYQDNGKAFKAKVFTANPDKHNLEDELAGLYYRAGTKPVFAMPYNARAKNIERFFLTMQNTFERMLPSFRGANILDKPADLKRNEKWVQKIFERKPLTINEFQAIFIFWVFNIYGKTPHKGLHNETPLEVFNQGNKEIDRTRRVKPADLNYMLLSVDKRKISNKGINLHRLFYWHEDLMNYIGQFAYIQYDPMNLSSILVYTEGRKKFICQATQQKLLHPLYHISDNPPQSKAELEKQLKKQKRLEKKHREYTESELKRIEKNSHLLPIEQKDDDKLFFDQPILKYKKKKTLDDKIKEIHSNIKDKKPEKIENTSENEEIINLTNLGF